MLSQEKLLFVRNKHTCPTVIDRNRSEHQSSGGGQQKKVIREPPNPTNASEDGHRGVSHQRIAGGAARPSPQKKSSPLACSAVTSPLTFAATCVRVQVQGAGIRVWG